MSYGIIRIQKFKKNDVRGIQSHDNRERKSLSNSDIDTTKSELNFSLVGCQNQNFSDKIQKNFEDINSTKAVRKDAVVMVQCLVTSDHDFFKNIPEPEKQRKFFEQSLAFIADRYGRGNIISATVHLDEKTPHMHVNLTPIKNQKLSAKSIFDRVELRKLHTDFYRSVGQKWGLERGESREEKRRHLDTAAFKLETSKAELEKAKQAEKDQQERVKLYQVQADEAEKEIQKDLEIPQGILNRKVALAKTLEQLELYKKSLADKHIIEAENKELRSKVNDSQARIESLTAQNHILESKNKENERSLLTLRKQYEDEYSKNKNIAKFFMEREAGRGESRETIAFKFSFWEQRQKAAAKQAASESVPKPSRPPKEGKEQEKRPKEKLAEQGNPVLAAPDLGLDKERRRVDQAFSEALRNTPGTAWDHMQEVKKLMEQWGKAPNRESFERQALNRLQELPQKKGFSR